MSAASQVVLDRRHSRMIDEIAQRDYGMQGLVLMENAGRGCAERLLKIGIDSHVAICCGQGNNGGDGFVIARHLHNANVDVRVLMTTDPQSLSEDARRNYEILAKMPLRIVGLTQAHSEQVSQSLKDESGKDPSWIVDALLGTGSIGPVRSELVPWIRAINVSAATRFAVDLPSGLDCDTGACDGGCVQADETGTFVSLKPCLLTDSGRRHAGNITVIDIGVPKEIVQRVERLQGATRNG